ncbi:MAG: HAMP domain-containing histidine kinase, partial [Deltaproteobacteria bacterium]|nr:HAMP domain-containing histidine kinase [Deltaproteobacteria bacterium]
YRVYKSRDSKCDDCPVEQTFGDGAIDTSEHLWFLKGQETHIVATANPVRNDKGEIVAVLEMCTNITEVKRLQSELALLGETVAGMSHAIKNILSGLQGGVYVVDSGLERGIEERVRQGWSMVKRNVEKISDLVKGILYAAKERVPEKEECDPGELLGEVCDMYEGKASSEGIALVREFGNSMGRGLLDREGIHSALSNLVANAIEACRTIGDRSHSITVAGHIEDRMLKIRATDDGMGMAEEVKERLFSKFYSTKGPRGTGLGLVITRKVVEEHGGTIQVQSARDQGTTFLIQIPWDEAAVQSK